MRGFLLCVDHGLQLATFTAGIGHRFRGQRAQHFVDVVLIGGGLIGQHKIGRRVVTQHARTLCTQLEDLRDDAGIVPLVASAAARHRSFVQALTQCAAFQLCFGWLAGGVKQRDHVFAGQVARLGCFCGGGNLLIAHALELFTAVHHNCRGVHFGQYVLVELGAQFGHLRIDFANAGLLCFAQRGAGPYKILVALFQQALVNGVQSQRVASVIQRLDAGKQFWIERNRVAVR